MNAYCKCSDPVGIRIEIALFATKMNCIDLFNFRVIFKLVAWIGDCHEEKEEGKKNTGKLSKVLKSMRKIVPLEK